MLDIKYVNGVATNVLVDPPQGWMYGFPAPLKENYEQQLRDANYPEKDIPFAREHTRFIILGGD